MTTIATSRPKRANLKTMRALYNTLVEYKDELGRSLITLFMQLPSRKEFPDYYEIIENPIAMALINEKIDKNKYSSEEALMDDFKLMFNNCKLYNQDDSQIYNDAVTLESVLAKRWKMFERANDVAAANDHNDIEHHHQTSTGGASVTIDSDSASLGNNNCNNLTSFPNNNNNNTVTSMDDSSQATNIQSTQAPGSGRRSKNDAPKRQLLTGYIIYASEIRKQVIDKNPDQSFGDISRLVGTEWKTLPQHIKSSYEQRALAHNAKVREKALAEAAEAVALGIEVSIVTPKISKRRQAQLAHREQLRNSAASLGPGSPSSNNHNMTNNANHVMDGHHMNGYQGQSNYIQHPDHHYLGEKKAIGNNKYPTHKTKSVASVGVQADIPVPLFVEPPPKRPLMYSETFKRYIETLQSNAQPSNRQPPVGPTTPVTHNPNHNNQNNTTTSSNVAQTTMEPDESELPVHWLANGIGEHESTSEALWALRDYMLNHACSIK